MHVRVVKEIGPDETSREEVVVTTVWSDVVYFSGYAAPCSP
jgi:hypothetical protein